MFILIFLHFFVVSVILDMFFRLLLLLSCVATSLIFLTAQIIFRLLYVSRYIRKQLIISNFQFNFFNNFLLLVSSFLVVYILLYLWTFQRLY